MKHILILLLVCTVITTNLVFAEDVNDIVKKVQKTYDKIDDFSATFKQIETFKITGSKSETVGKIFVSGGEKYRFESEDQTIATDGKTVWTYNTQSKQLLIDNVREDSGVLLPRDLLFKYPKTYFATLLSQDDSGKHKIYEIRLDPKENVYGYIKSIKLWIEDKTWLVQKIETTDLNGNTSLFEISDQNTKAKIDPEIYKLKPDADTEVVDMR